MQYYSFPLPNGTVVQTCPAAMGYSFAGGTTDGPGAFNFVQGDNASQAQNPFWAAVSDLLTTPTQEQSFRVGQLIMIISPSEATTMTGRRWKAAVAAAAINQSIVTSTPKVVLGGPANTYAHYAATPEEYSVQRYEGASTLYGQWESYAYIHLSTSNIHYLKSGAGQPAQGTYPPNNVKNSLCFIAGVVYDNPPFFTSFGDVLTQPKSSYSIGDVVNATFVGANPRNNLRLEGTFTEVQQLSNGIWTTVRDDHDWYLEYTWYRDDLLLGSSHVVISWETEDYTTPGTYRIVYNGDSKAPLTGEISAFTGISNSFTVA
jgi:neutral ceramidase